MGSHGASWGGAAYDRARESFSNPLMRRCESQYRFATLQTYPDGVTSDFHFAAEQGAQHAWRYPDLTTHVRYFSDLLRDGRSDIRRLPRRRRAGRPDELRRPVRAVRDPCTY